jgi:hypothetical protein
MAIHLDSSVTLVPLSIVPDGEAYIVGNVDRDVFVALPETGVVAIKALVAGHSVAESAADAAAHAGEPVDVAAFVEGLIDVGLVVAVDGLPVGTAPETDPSVVHPHASVTPSRMVLRLFSPLAWIVYGLLTCVSVGLFVARPYLWPSFDDVLFHPNIALSLVTMAVLSCILPAVHESAHCLAARAVGVRSRFTIGRRQYVPVFETDLSGLWSLPRRSRYSPFLAGMAFDVVILTACLVPRWAVSEGWIELPSLLVAFLGAVVLRQVLGLAWQTMIFLRTDLYVVLVTALGCYQLQRVTQLTVRKWARRLRPDDRAELMTAHPRDAQVARWFAPLTVVGLAGLYVYLVAFLIPGIVFVEQRVVTTLMTAPATGGAFWQALTVGLVISLQVLLPIGIFLWQRVSSLRLRGPAVTVLMDGRRHAVSD